MTAPQARPAPCVQPPSPLPAHGLQELSQWPTYPQLYVGGELLGGCDIVLEMHEAGELQVGAAPGPLRGHALVSLSATERPRPLHPFAGQAGAAWLTGKPPLELSSCCAAAPPRAALKVLPSMHQSQPYQGNRQAVLVMRGRSALAQPLSCPALCRLSWQRHKRRATHKRHLSSGWSAW